MKYFIFIYLIIFSSVSLSTENYGQIGEEMEKRRVIEAEKELRRWDAQRSERIDNQLYNKNKKKSNASTLSSSLSEIKYGRDLTKKECATVRILFLNSMNCENF
jgi:hypothetical protein